MLAISNIISVRCCISVPSNMCICRRFYRIIKFFKSVFEFHAIQFFDLISEKVIIPKKLRILLVRSHFSHFNYYHNMKIQTWLSIRACDDVWQRLNRKHWILYKFFLYFSTKFALRAESEVYQIGEIYKSQTQTVW